MTAHAVFVGLCVLSFAAGFACGVIVTLLRLEGRK